MRRVESVEEALPASGDDGEDPEVELVDEVVLEQRPIELADVYDVAGSKTSS